VAIATPLGVVAAHVEQRAFTAAGVLPPGIHLVVSWLPIFAGLLAAIVTTQAASFASARRAARIGPTEALREARADRRLISWLRALAGLAAVVGGFVVLLQPDGGRDGVAPAAALVWMLAVALLGPVLAWPFTVVIGAPLGLLRRGPGRLAHANTRASLRRVASVAAPIMLAIALAGTIVYCKMIVRHEAIRQAVDRTTAASVVRARGGDGITPATVGRIRRIPGVTAASGSSPTTVLVAVDGTNLRRFDARAIDASTLAAVADLDVTAGSIAAIRNDALAVSTDLAAQLHRHVGDRIDLRLGDGARIAPRIAATYRRSLGFGDVLMPHAQALAHVNHPLDDLVFVASRSGDEQVVRQQLERLDPSLQVLERSRYVGSVQVAAEKDALTVYVLLGLIVAFCALALVNAITMSTAERSRELALLRLVGAERRQLRSMIRIETAIMVVFGITIGTLIAVPGLALFSRDVSGDLLPDVSLRLYAGLVGLYAVLAFIATAVPVRLAGRVDPVQALAARE